MSSVHEEDDRDFDGDINVDDVDSDSRISCESDIDLDGSCYDDNEMHLRWVFGFFLVPSAAFADIVCNASSWGFISQAPKIGIVYF